MLKKRGKAANGGDAGRCTAQRPRARVQAESLYAQGAIRGKVTASNGVTGSGGRRGGRTPLTASAAGAASQAAGRAST